MKWYRKAAEQSYAPAQFNVGIMCESGQGTPQDYVQAHKWFNLAAAWFPASDRKSRARPVTRRDKIASQMTPGQVQGVNVLKPHQKSTVFTLLQNRVSQREISRKTGIDRKTIRRLALQMASPLVKAEPNSPTLATGSQGAPEQIPPPRPPASETATAPLCRPGMSLGYKRPVTHDSAQFGEKGFSPGDLFRRRCVAGGTGWIFTGRSDQLLKVYGRWVDTVALEQWLLEKMQHEVRELSIIPHNVDAGTVSLNLFVVPKGGQEHAVKSLVRSVCDQLPAFKRPAFTHVLDELPRTETGKIRRGALKTLTHRSQ
jgi:acyl-CoA synthetase (AMP-forming)/AMP-acid ligase II